MKYDVVCDASGLLCPQVLIKAKQCLAMMKKGEVLKVISTDPSSVLDFKVFAEMTSHELMHQSTEKEKFMFWVKK